jgi:hypothetical protein
MQDKEKYSEKAWKKKEREAKKGFLDFKTKGV